MKRFRSNLYTAQKIVCADRQHVYVENEDGYLFAQAIYPTKIKAEDLPEWYVYGRYYKCFGYLSAKGVVDMKYVPSRYSIIGSLMTVKYERKQHCFDGK